MHSHIPRTIIAKITAEVFQTTLSELRSASRQRRLTYARFAVWHLLHELRPGLSDGELADVLNKDRTSAIHGLERVSQFIAGSREFAARIDRARGLIAEWRPAAALAARNAPPLGYIAKTRRTPPASEIEAREPSYHGSPSEYEAWFRNSCKRSEDRYLKLASAIHPERVLRTQREAAE